MAGERRAPVRGGRGKSSRGMATLRRTEAPPAVKSEFNKPSPRIRTVEVAVSLGLTAEITEPVLMLSLRLLHFTVRLA